MFSFFFFFNDTATTEIYTLSLHDALPISQLAYGITTRSDDDRTADWRRRAGRGLRDHAELRATPAAVRRRRSKAGGTPPGRPRSYRYRAADRAAAGRDRRGSRGVRGGRGRRIRGRAQERRRRQLDDPQLLQAAHRFGPARDGAQGAHRVLREGLPRPLFYLLQRAPLGERGAHRRRHLQRLERVGDGEDLHRDRQRQGLDVPVLTHDLVVVPVLTDDLGGAAHPAGHGHRGVRHRARQQP